jgi:hypothetical protein
MVEIRHAGSADLLAPLLSGRFFCGCIFAPSIRTSRRSHGRIIISCHGTALGRKRQWLHLLSLEGPNMMLYEGEPDMDIDWQLPCAPQRDTETVCQESQSQDGRRLVI